MKHLPLMDRWLAAAARVVGQDGSAGRVLPPVAGRIPYRIAVAFGGRGEVFMSSADCGKGFVHVMDDQGFADVLGELDTITDLTHYLAATEGLAGRRVRDGGDRVGGEPARLVSLPPAVVPRRGDHNGGHRRHLAGPQAAAGVHPP